MEKQNGEFYLWREKFKKLKAQLKRQNSDNEYLMLYAPEENFIDGDWCDQIKNKNIKAIFGGYDRTQYNYYWRNFFKENNVEFELWDNFFLYHCIEQMPEKIIQENKKNIYNETHLKALFICMNHNPRTHRIHMLDMLAKYKLLKNNYYSWHYTKAASDYWETNYWNIKVRILDRTIGDLRQELYPKEFYHSFIDVVTETSPTYNFITEKTYYPILYRKPFMIAGPAGCHQYLESLGYKLPRNIINYDFDNENNWKIRLELIAQELHRLSKLNWRSFIKEVDPIVEHNRNLMLENAINEVGVPESVKSVELYKKMLSHVKYTATRLK